MVGGFDIAGSIVRFDTRSDLFSPKGLDMGTELLIKSLATQEYTTALDWGCGWGALALWLATHNSQAQVTALDSDMSAIKAVRDNVRRNGLKNIEIVPSTGYEDLVEDAQFDLIVSHPPTHRGRDVVETMITQSLGRLTPGGTLAIVVEARLKPWVQRSLNEAFGSCTVAKRTNKHVVLTARRPT